MSHSCALHSQGKLNCWGWNLHGQADSGQSEFKEFESLNLNFNGSEDGIKNKSDDKVLSYNELILKAVAMIHDDSSNVKNVVE